MHKFVSFDGNDAGQNKDYLQERFVSAKFSSDDENATLSFAKNFAKHLKFGDFLALFGELGVGKTIFVKGLCEGLGFYGDVSSPTFALVNEYWLDGAKERGACSSNRFVIVHCDMFRVKSELDLESIGFFDYLEYPNRIMVVEWSENISGFLPNDCYRVSLSYAGNNKRLIKIERQEVEKIK